jgi:hypothetical protein
MAIYGTSGQWYLAVLAMASPACILPVITGLVFLGSNRFRSDALNWAATAFALKPLLATPIWAALWLWSGYEADHQFYYLTILPGMLLTVILVIAFRNLFKTHSLLVSLLLVGDVIRWVYTFIMFAPWLEFSAHNKTLDVWYPIALILPNAYAAAVLLMAFLRARQSNVSSRAVSSSQLPAG